MVTARPGSLAPQDGLGVVSRYRTDLTSLSHLRSTSIMSSDKTLLMNFIVESLAGYQNPTRRGVRKGQKIGFSQTKYAAALFELYDYVTPSAQEIAGTLGELARNLKTTPHVIWQWRTEKEYRERVEFFASEFCKRFMQAIEAARETYVKAADRYAAEQLVKPLLQSHPPSILTYLQPQICDAVAYSTGLQIKIALAMEDQIKKASTKHESDKLLLFSLIVSFFKTDAERNAPTKEIEQLLQELFQQLRDGLFGAVSATLSKPRPTRSERKEAMLALVYLREEFGKVAQASNVPKSRSLPSRDLRRGRT